MAPASLADLVAAGDLDGLVREVDRRAARGDWDGVTELRRRCLEAAEATGRQLWGPAQYAAYRLALEGPAALAASVLAPGAAPFALGPLTEVVAQHHTWAELAPHLDVPFVAATVAQERVLRGEDLTAHASFAADDHEPPLVLQPWEPAYPLPEYRAAELLENGPPAPDDAGEEVAAAPGAPTRVGRLARAVHDLAGHWEEHSTGAVRVAVVVGGAPEAVAAVGTPRLRSTPVGLADALARMAWAAASGGAHARRRGLAAGRSAAWEVARQAAGGVGGGDADELEFELEELRWYVFSPAASAVLGAADAGWTLRLAVEHPSAGWAAAVDAVDPPRVAG